MRKRWIPIGLAVGLLAMAATGGVALAWGGSGHGLGWGWGGGDREERNTAVAAKVAEILGTDAEETADAIAQAQQEVKEETADAALEDLAGRVAETLGTDADETAAAIEKVSGEMFDEALEEKLQDALDDGRITEEQAQEYRDRADSYSGWYGLGHGSKGFRSFKGGISEEFADGVAEELGVDGGDVKDAIEQSLSDIGREELESRLQDALDDGRITQEQADEIFGGLRLRRYPLVQQARPPRAARRQRPLGARPAASTAKATPTRPLRRSPAATEIPHDPIRSSY